MRQQLCGELYMNIGAHPILRMTNYFSNAFFHKRISDSFIASQEGAVGKIVATVKCEDLREVVAQDSFLVGSPAGGGSKVTRVFRQLKTCLVGSVLLIGSPLV